MNLSRDSVLALQRHFVGSLHLPARTWLEAVPSTRLAFAGSALRKMGSDCMLDFGMVETPGEERCTLRVFHPALESPEVQLDDFPSWLAVRWLDRTTLELTATHDGEAEHRGSLRFHAAGMEPEELGVRMTTRRTRPAARLDFNGQPAARPFDFGLDDHPYQLSVGNDSSVPLVVTFADLPAWLTFEVDGHRRNGPLPGRFFERTAPFAVHIRPRLFGRFDGTIRMQTNDPRPELQTVDLRFSGCLEPARPFLHVVAPFVAMRLRADQKLTTEARLENWGRTAARIAATAVPRGLAVPSLPLVPAAHNGIPGTAVLPIRIVPSQLAPGAHTLSLTLRVEDGEPETVDVTVRVDILAATRRRTTPWRAAFLALLLLTLVLFVMQGLP